MKAIEWQKFFIDQRQQHGKLVFSVAELANVARTSAHALNTELGRLLARGILHRHAKGLYGADAEVHPEHVVRAIDPCAYITGLAALCGENLVTQQAAEVTCFTNRRHNRSRSASSARLNLKFYHVSSAIYAMPKQSVFAMPEQALCDFVYLACRENLDPRHLVTFRKLDRLHPGRLKKIAARYPVQAQIALARIVNF